jgi:ketosteroid isomerase-like protein
VSSAEEDKAIVRRFLEELNKGNLDVIDELLSPDFEIRERLFGGGGGVPPERGYILWPP